MRGKNTNASYIYEVMLNSQYKKHQTTVLDYFSSAKLAKIK